MPKQKHMSWSVIILMVLHLASLIFFLYKHFRSPPPPPILAINLDERTDRWQEVQKEFSNWLPPIERVSAVKYSPGWKGCTLSHRKAVEIAKQRHYPWVLIVEDDCLLTSGAQQQFQELIPYLWKHQEHWDIFLGGITHIENPHLVSKSPPIFKLKGTTAHFCLIHSKTYNKILHHIPTDPQKLTEAEIIDVWYSKNLRLWTTVPFLAIQRPSHSDNENTNQNYTQMFKDSETALRKLLI